MTTNRRTFLKVAGAVAATNLVASCSATTSNNVSTSSLAAAQTTSSAQRGTATAAKKTLAYVSHPYPERSVLTVGMQHAAESVNNVTVRNLESLYGFDTRAIDTQAETAMTREHDRIVFIFPTHWFNIPPMMKAYLNDVWGNVGPGLWEGKEMLIVTTASGGDTTYGENGRIGISLADVFWPMKASALHAGMTYLPPLAFESASASDLDQYQQQLVERLTQG